ncbi:MAG TPA: VOC family protein [Acidimicrobiales bacterium]|jgi:catechol-2,3-dioxygenase
MTEVARLGGVTLDCDDPVSLASFWRELLGLEVLLESEDYVALSGAGVLITAMRVDAHQRPDWPESTVPKQIHLELAVSDLDAAEARALELGAVQGATQVRPDLFRVMLDPAGHPFCLTTMIPEAQGS